jgi:hypothetical protein
MSTRSKDIEPDEQSGKAPRATVSAMQTANGQRAATSADQRAAERTDGPRWMTLKRATMVAATAFLSVNIWTGAPLVALWVGSQVSGRTVLSMKAVLVVILVLAILVLALAVALTWLNNTYDQLIGRPQGERRAPWLRSMRSESGREISDRVGITALEQVVMVSVYLAVITLVVWFFFFAGSPLSQ